MWPQFWRNPFRSQKLFLGLLLAGSLTGVSAQDHSALGILKTAEELVEIQTQQHQQLRGQVSTNPMALSQLAPHEKIKLESRFAKLLLFNSEKKYLDLIKNNSCTLYSLIENQLLKTGSGDLNNLIISLQKENGEVENAIVTKENFLETIYKRECTQNRDIATLFSNNNIAATFRGIQFTVPKNQEQCQQIVSDWNKNPNTPYFCRIAETLKNGLTARLRITQLASNQVQQRRELQALAEQYDFYQNNISHFHRTYIINACNHLDHAENFCRVYLADDIWNKIINGERPTWPMSYRCSDMLGKADLTMDDLRGCATQLNESPDLCRTSGSTQFQGLFPHHRCDTISQALSIAKLHTDYRDCPGQIDNEGIINIVRLLNHFDPPKENKGDPQTCASNTHVRFAELNINFDNQSAWPLQICHEDRVTGGERCHAYVPGHHPTSELSEAQVVTQILIRNNNLPKETKCRVVDIESYNPNLLEFKTGCTILYNRNECTALHCPKKILYEQKEITDLTYKGTAIFDYFPNSFRNEKFALANILKETLKLESRAIRNLTELTFFLRQEGNGVVHGVGCVEDILPERFRRVSFNQCRPMPFIIDGIQTDDLVTRLVTRLPIEDIHSPRFLNWNHIFNGITNYQKLHPLDSWMMYGLKK